MTWSFRLLTVAGTEVRVHLTFFLLLAWFGAVQWMAAGPEAAAFAVVFIVLLFLCVLLHEFGHVFAARRYGIRTPDITLLPIGGLASLERMPEKPSQEIFVALAGPAVNVIIAFILVAFAGARLDPRALDLMENPASDMLSRLAIANVALVVFNLIPAFPMDGGRVLRALLAMRMGFVRATRTAAFVGQSLAFFLGFIGLLGNPLLILIAVFVYLAATAESQYVEMRSLARGYLARDAMITKFEHLTPTSTADDAVALLLRTTPAGVSRAGSILAPAGPRDARCSHRGVARPRRQHACGRVHAYGRACGRWHSDARQRHPDAPAEAGARRCRG